MAPGPLATRTTDVVIAGAGLAGLVAARELRGHGLDAIVLEARGRVGGRMVAAPTASGALVDLGGQWVGPTQERILALADELGAERFPSHRTGDTVYAYGGDRGRVDEATFEFRGAEPPAFSAELAEIERVVGELVALAATVPPDAPWDAPGAAALDSQTLDAWLAGTTGGGMARWLVTLQARLGGSGAFEPEEVSLLHALWTLRVAPQNEHPETELFADCAGAIPLRLAAELGDAIVLSAPVRALVHDARGVRAVTAGGGSIDARAAIVAMPPALAGRIAYEPALPAQRDQLTQRMPLGALAKVHAIYPTAFWRADGRAGLALGDLPTLGFTADSSPPSGEPGILTGFVTGRRLLELAAAGPGALEAAALADLRAYFGAEAARPLETVVLDWTAEPYSRGAFTAFLGPLVWTTCGPALRAPVGRVHWAGTETATRWPGYFDGAVRSGEAAAAAVAAQLG